jgi:hypothetical protein
MYCLNYSPKLRDSDTNDSDDNDDDGYAALPICVFVLACVHARVLILKMRVHKTKHYCSRWKTLYWLQTAGNL